MIAARFRTFCFPDFWLVFAGFMSTSKRYTARLTYRQIIDRHIGCGANRCTQTAGAMGILLSLLSITLAGASLPETYPWELDDWGLKLGTSLSGTIVTPVALR